MTAPVQLDLDTYAARRAGELAADACAEKAERLGFDIAAAKAAVLECLAQWPGGRSGEDLTDYCLAKGIVPHNHKAFGAIFAALARAGLIIAAGYCKRRKGNGTGGATLWKLSNQQAA